MTAWSVEDKGEGMTLDKVRQLMRDEAQALFDKGADEPKISAKIDFVQMGDDARYAQYRQLRNVYLFDTVHIWHPPQISTKHAQPVRKL